MVQLLPKHFFLFSLFSEIRIFIPSPSDQIRTLNMYGGSVPKYMQADVSPAASRIIKQAQSEDKISSEKGRDNSEESFFVDDSIYHLQRVDQVVTFSKISKLSEPCTGYRIYFVEAGGGNWVGCFSTNPTDKQFTVLHLQGRDANAACNLTLIPYPLWIAAKLLLMVRRQVAKPTGVKYRKRIEIFCKKLAEYWECPYKNVKWAADWRAMTATERDKFVELVNFIYTEFEAKSAVKGLECLGRIFAKGSLDKDFPKEKFKDWLKNLSKGVVVPWKTEP